MLDDRNRSSKLYDEGMAMEMFDKVQFEYFALLTGFKNDVEK